MKTRFRKVWCSSCSSMQFAGECGHVTNSEGPGPKMANILSLAERRAPSMSTKLLGFARDAFKGMPDELLHKMGLRRVGRPCTCSSSCSNLCCCDCHNPKAYILGASP